MKTSFTNITRGWWSKTDFRFLFAVFFQLTTSITNGFSFQLDESPEAEGAGISDYQKMEAGMAPQGAVAPVFWHLSEGRYTEALESLTPEGEVLYPWLREYLTGLVEVAAPLISKESNHFIVFTPPSQAFLADYALESLEKTATHIENQFGHRPNGKIRVEIYENKENFSKASTLTIDTLERSGAIGICKFHRLMILSPQALPMGYRWLDALSHEYIHLIVNELTESRAELWLHEGTARYFETSYRADPPVFVTPHQQTSLLNAQEKGTLIPFKRMSPSMVYLKDQDEVSLAFSQVSYAVSLMVRDKGVDKFAVFLKSLRRLPFEKAFIKTYRLNMDEFDHYWKGRLAEEKWEKSIGALSDEIRFSQWDENSAVGADAQGQMRLGDRMRQKGYMEAAQVEYEKALKAEPDNAVLLLKSARTDLALNRKDRAIDKLRKATEKNPNYETAHIELAFLVNPEEALSHLREANAINPFDPRVHKGFFEVYETMGKTQDANREKAIYNFLIEKNR